MFSIINNINSEEMHGMPVSQWESSRAIIVVLATDRGQESTTTWCYA